MLKNFAPLEKMFLYRPHRLTFDRAFMSGDWSREIDHLMAAGYGFKAEKFSDHGYLFRGMSSGVLEALELKQFGHFSGDSETNLAEQIMQIFFVTHELSDAVTAANLYTGGRDGAVLVFKAALFNRALQAGSAAIMEVGDMGVIFRYPFLTQPLLLADLSAIIVSDKTKEKITAQFPELAQPVYSVPSGQQKQTLSIAESLLAERGWSEAAPESCGIFPSFKNYR